MSVALQISRAAAKEDARTVQAEEEAAAAAVVAAAAAAVAAVAAAEEEARRAQAEEEARRGGPRKLLLVHAYPAERPKPVHAKRTKTDRPSRQRPIVPIKREDVAGGLIRCPQCETALQMNGGCSLVTCRSEAHDGQYFYFCYHCRSQCPDRIYCPRCPGRNTVATRNQVLQRDNEQNRQNPIEL